MCICYNHKHINYLTSAVKILYCSKRRYWYQSHCEINSICKLIIIIDVISPQDAISCFFFAKKKKKTNWLINLYMNISSYSSPPILHLITTNKINSIYNRVDIANNLRKSVILRLLCFFLCHQYMQHTHVCAHAAHIRAQIVHKNR